MKKQILTMILMAIIFSGCDTLSGDAIRKSKEIPTTQDDFFFDKQLKSTEPYISEKTSSSDKVVDIETKAQSPKPDIYKGTDKQVKLPADKKPVILHGDAVTLNFEQAPLIDVVHAIMGDILQLDYIVEHPIDGEITLRTRSPVQRDQLLTILETLLQSNGALMIHDKENRFVISASGSAAKLRPSLSGPKSKGAGYSTMIIPLQYIGAAEMADILRPLATDSAFLRIDNVRNMLMLAGTRKQLDGWLEIIATFDIDLLAGMSVGIFPLENTSVAEMDEALKSVLGSGGQTTESLMQALRIIPIERLNSIIVVTPRAHYLEQAEIWIERLDKAQAVDSELDRQLFVYPVENGSSEHLADLLSKIFSGTGGDATRKSKDSGVAPGLTPEKVSSTGNKSSSQQGVTGNSSQKAASSTVIGNAKVVADEDNNALLIYATKSEYRDIEQALKQLDVQPAQVLVQASILEVSLTDGLEYGVEWFTQHGLSGDRTGTGQLVLSGTDVAAVVPGFSYQIVDAFGDLNVVLNALAKDSLINVISTPSVLVLDNNTAKIQVGNQQPIQSTQNITDGGVISQSIEFKDTGVMLSVTPSINAGGMVTMDVTQSVTDVGEIDAATGQRSFLTRDVESRVAVRSGESVVLGGLIRDNKTLTNSGVPILKDIPWVGALFSKTIESTNRVELMIIITPTVLYNEQDLRDVSRELRSQVRGLVLFEDQIENEGQEETQQ